MSSRTQKVVGLLSFFVTLSSVGKMYSTSCCAHFIKSSRDSPRCRYYIHTLLDTTEKPLLLVSEEEVKKLFQKIREQLDIHVTFPSVSEEPGFQLEFLQEGSPRPRYLGRLTEDNDMAALEDMLPAKGSAAEEVEKLDERSFPIFRRYMQLALEAGKQKSRAVRDKRKLDRIDMKKKRCAELKRTQCYLGLRKRGNISEDNSITGPNMSWEETKKAQDAYEVAAGIKIPPLNTSVPAPCPLYRAPVFICVDIEVWEMDHRSLTEIGVCTLDTRDLINVAPGEKGKEWMKRLRCRHFRILENAHLNNVEYVTGCADRFEFGQSEWISLKDAPSVLASCFKAPFSEPGKYAPYPTDPKQGSFQASKPKQLIKDVHGEKRNLLLVGHEIGADIGYMRSAGYDVGNLPNLIEAIDTTVLFRAYKHEQNPKNLGAVLLDLGMTGWNLHNAVSSYLLPTQNPFDEVSYRVMMQRTPYVYFSQSLLLLYHQPILTLVSHLQKSSILPKRWPLRVFARTTKNGPLLKQMVAMVAILWHCYRGLKHSRRQHGIRG